MSQLKTCAILATTLIAALGTSSCRGGTNLSTPHVPQTGHALLLQHPDTSPGTDMTSRITHAGKRVWMEMYSLNDDDVVNALIDAKKRGLDVRVMLNHGYGVSGSTKKSYETLMTNHVPVKWAPSGYIFHIKTTLIDDAAVISSANLNRNNYSSHRDYTIVDAQDKQVSAIASTFSNDWALKGKPRANTVKADGLVWSPDALDSFVSMIHSTKKSIVMTSEEFKNPKIAQAIVDVAKNKISCAIAVPYQSGSSNVDEGQIKSVKDAGCSFQKIDFNASSGFGIYEHGKIIIVDGREALLGSQNDSTTSLTKNRELSIQLDDPDLVRALTTTVKSDLERR